MPKVPDYPTQGEAPQAKIPDVYLAMAAAQMHELGRWNNLPTSENIEDRRGDPKRVAAAQVDLDNEFGDALRLKGNPRRLTQSNEPPMKRIEPK